MHKENKTKENKMISRYERECGTLDDGWISRSPYMSVGVELSSTVQIASLFIGFRSWNPSPISLHLI